MTHPDFDSYTVEWEALITYDADAVASMEVYTFEYIDNLHFLLPPPVVIRDAKRCGRLCEAVSRRFKEEGWEGTGRLSLLWLPKFVFPHASDCGYEGVILWHVKQHEDGISWLLSPLDLPFEYFGG
jgi:hypothetical protein